MYSNNLETKEKEEINQIKAKSQIKKIRSKYILQIIFHDIKMKILFNVVKYNKDLQKKIDINIKDYKEYSEIYSSIEIEIKPVNNKNGQFIHKENENYYHIYFNDSKEEIKRNYLKENENVNKLKIILDYQIKSLGRLFLNCECIESLYFKKCNRNNINNMELMFYGCSSLKEINLSHISTNNVTNMGGMFFGCSSLKELNLSNFNTNNVKNMGYMFFGCSSLEELNITNFNTNKVTDMRYMFKGCSDQFKNKIRAVYKNLKQEAFEE